MHCLPQKESNLNYVVPVLILLLFVFALLKRVNVYDGFVAGVKQSVGVSLSVFPCLVATFLMVNAMNASGLDKVLAQMLSPFFAIFGVPNQLIQLILIRPFSGAGSLAILSDVFANFGVDSHVGRSASVIFGSSETVFYISAVYFSQTKVTKTGWAIPIALFCNFVGGVVACLLCKVM